MKRFALILLVLALTSGQAAFAASSMIASRESSGSTDDVLLVKVTCIAHTDGTFTDTYPNGKQITTAEIGFDYWKRGFFLMDAWAVNPASTYPTAGAVTITDETGRQIVGTNATDTLTLSTAASGVGYLTIERASGQRAVTSKLTVAISDTGSAANTLNLYLLMRRAK